MQNHSSLFEDQFIEVEVTVSKRFPVLDKKVREENAPSTTFHQEFIRLTPWIPLTNTEKRDFVMKSIREKYEKLHNYPNKAKIYKTEWRNLWKRKICSNKNIKNCKQLKYHDKIKSQDKIIDSFKTKPPIYRSFIREPSIRDFSNIFISIIASPLNWKILIILLSIIYNKQTN